MTATGPSPRPVVVAEIVRSGFVEGHHYGSWVVLGRDGGVLAAAGDVESPLLPRSCNKPIQALGMLEAGLSLDGELLALACASHSGEEFQVVGVRRILASARRDESAPQTPPDWARDVDPPEGLKPPRPSKASVQN
jgi:L-asparaginase II